MEQEQVVLLLNKWRNGNTTRQEERVLEAWFESLVASGETVLHEDQKKAWKALILQRIQTEIVKENPRPLIEHPVSPQRIHFMHRFRWVAAAIFILALVSVWVLVQNQDRPVQQIAQTDVPAPNTNRATLLLANGETVYLNNAVNGQLAMQGGVSITKLANGQIAYEGKATELSYNTLINPKGSQPIQMRLPDGSLIWLNAGSSVTYPVAFVGKERRIRMSGELYYEITHDANRPFIIEKGSASIRVYGTKFNVKAYDNDTELKVTLLEGAVGVRKETQSQMLKPGQQAIVKERSISLIENADTEEAMAWKNGVISFHNANLGTVLKEMERWYNIDTEIKGSIPGYTFYADIQRSASLAVLLKLLEENKVNYAFDIEKRKLMVLP